MAARSDRLTASALWPRASGSTSGKKCVPETIVSVETARSMPLVTSTSAQSSPTPSTALAAGRVKCRAMRSNSGELIGILGPPFLRDLVGPHRRGELVEDAVHVLVSIGAAETLAQLDRLVDRDAIGDLAIVHELPRAQQQDRALDGADFIPLPVGEGLEPRAQVAGLADGAAQLRHEELAVRAVEILQLRKVLQHVGHAVARVDPLVDPLHRKLARAPARRKLHPPTAFSVFAISMATRAASAPFTAARALACSSVSVVSTAFATASK